MEKKDWEIPLFPIEEKIRRHKAIRELMGFRNIDCLIIPGMHANYGANRANLRYVSNYAQWYDEEHVIFPLEGEGVLLVFSPTHYSWAPRISWLPVKLSSKREHIKNIVDEIKKLGLEKKTVGIVDMEIMSASIYRGLMKELSGATIVDATDILKSVRMVKSPLELEFVRKAGEIADIGFKAMLETAEDGVADCDVWTACERAMIRAGGEPPSFTLYCSSPWPDRGVGSPYGPQNRKLKKGDIIYNEITPSYGGYWIQFCRPISIGEPPDGFKRALEVQEEIYHVAEGELRRGNTEFEVHKKTRELAAKRGYYLYITLQHIGLENIDTIPSNAAFRPGMVFVNHPLTLYPLGAPEVGGHIIGDTVIITEGAPEHLTKIPFQLFKK